MLGQPNLADPLGLRNRAILEVLYSTGIRRVELVDLKLSILTWNAERCWSARAGKKDRLVPIGDRAAPGEESIREARPQLAVEPDQGTLSWRAGGEEISADDLTPTVPRTW